MQFVVPQFIDVEDKIIGPLSVRQFIYLIVGTGLLFAAYRFADFGLFIFEAFFIVVFTMGFAFIRVNGRPFQSFLVNLFQTFRKPRLRIWKMEHERIATSVPTITDTAAKVPEKVPLTASRLNELSLIVDTGGAFKQEDTV